MELHEIFIEDDGSFGIKLPKKTKKQILFEKRDLLTACDFKILTREIKEDFTFMFKRALKERPCSSDSYVSPKGFFYQNGKYLQTIKSLNFGRSEGHFPNRETRFNTVIFTDRRIELFSCDEWVSPSQSTPLHIAMSRKLKALAWEILFEEKYVSVPFSKSPNQNRYYNYIKLYEKCDEDLRETIRMLFPRLDYGNLYNNVKLFEYRNFTIKGTKMHFFYQNSEVVMKIGKGIRKMLKVYGVGDIDDDQLKKTVDRILALENMNEMVVVTGDDIDKYYNYKSYCEDTNTNSLSNSCMRYDSCVNDNYFQVYKDHASMLICLNKVTKKITGRAILWDNALVLSSEDSDLVDKKIKVMDRIYGNERTYVKFFDWASENNFYRKRYQTYDNSVSFVPPKLRDGDEIEINMSLDISLTDYSAVPYMDTFAWCSDSELRNEEDFSEYSARDTDGSLYSINDENEDY